MLASLEDAQLEGKVQTTEQAKRYVLSKFRPKMLEKREEEPPLADKTDRDRRGTAIRN